MWSPTSLLLRPARRLTTAAATSAGEGVHLQTDSGLFGGLWSDPDLHHPGIQGPLLEMGQGLQVLGHKTQQFSEVLL